MRIMLILLGLLVFYLFLHLPSVHRAICPYPEVGIWLCRI